ETFVPDSAEDVQLYPPLRPPVSGTRRVTRPAFQTKKHESAAPPLLPFVSQSAPRWYPILLPERREALGLSFGAARCGFPEADSTHRANAECRESIGGRRLALRP